MYVICDALVLSTGQQISNSQVVGLSPGWAPLGKLLTPVCLCHQAV